MITLLKKIAQKLGVDFDIGNTLLLRLWSTVSGALLVLIIPIFLSTYEQGYYFTFSSLIGMQIFFELGFNFVITQMISHEMASVNLSSNCLTGNTRSINRIYSLIYLLLKWYGVISILFFCFVSILGYYFFSLNGTLPEKHWLGAWLLVTLFSAVNLFFSPFFSVLEGIGLVGRVARIRLLQSIAGYSILACLFLLGFRLYAIAAISGMAAFIGGCSIVFKYKKILFSPIKFLSQNNCYERISWRYEIFPFQWKIAISWLSGYFIFQLFNPLVFAHQGPSAAGKLGLSIAIFSAIMALSISWVNAKTPTISRLISANNKSELNPFFLSLVVKSSLINILCSGSFILLVTVAQKYLPIVTDRLSEISVLILLSCITLVNHIIFCLANYMRSHKEEPMLFNSIVTGVMVSTSIYFASFSSVYMTILSYFLVLIFICLPWTLVLFNKYYNEK